jgi:hypothetical protein
MLVRTNLLQRTLNLGTLEAPQIRDLPYAGAAELSTNLFTQVEAHYLICNTQPFTFEIVVSKTKIWPNAHQSSAVPFLTHRSTWTSWSFSVRPISYRNRARHTLP